MSSIPPRASANSIVLPSTPANEPSSFASKAPSGRAMPASNIAVLRLRIHPCCTALVAGPPPNTTEPTFIRSPIPREKPSSSSNLIPSAAAAVAAVP